MKHPIWILKQNVNRLESRLIRMQGIDSLKEKCINTRIKIEESKEALFILEGRL